MPDPILVPIGAFPEGMDSLHEEHDPVFNPGEGPPARAVDLSNVDLDDRGRPQLRYGTEQQVSATTGLSTFSALGLLFFQDGGTIKRVTGVDPFTTANVVTGLSSSAVVEFTEHAGEIYWTNGIANGKIIAAGTATNWGMTVPPSPTLGTTSGSLAAGRYLVAATLLDANGVESGGSKSSAVSTNGSQAITADLSSTDSNAVTAQFWISRVNGDELYYAGAAAVGSLPVTITSSSASDIELRRQHFSPPVPGDGLFSFRGMILTFKDSYIYPSYGPDVHLFKLDETEIGFPTDVKSGAGLSEGFWVVCTRGAFWVSGENPWDWNIVQKDSREYAKGALALPGSYIPRLNTAENVALFVSEHGLMAGLPDGSMVPLEEDKKRLDVSSKRASIVRFEHPRGYDQILYSLY